MIFRGGSKRIAEAGVTPPAVGRPQSASRRTGMAAAVGIAAVVTIGAMSLSASSATGATARTDSRDSSAGTTSGQSGLNHFGLSVGRGASLPAGGHESGWYYLGQGGR